MNTHSLDLELSSSQYAYVADNVPLSITGDISIEAWIKLEQLPSTAGTAFQIVDKNGSYQFIINTSNKLQWVSTNDGTYAAGSQIQTVSNVAFTSSNVGQWTHIVVTCDVSASGCLFYINGVETTSTYTLQNATSIYNSTGNFVIGANAAPDTYFDGLIDDVRVWNDIRTADEIITNISSELVGNEAGLVGYWKLNNDYLDETSNNNDLTSSGSPVFSTSTPFYEAHLFSKTLNLSPNGGVNVRPRIFAPGNAR